MLLPIQMVEIDTLFQAKTAKKTYPLERHIPIYSLYKGPPPPPRRLPGAQNALQIESRCLRKRDE